MENLLQIILRSGIIYLFIVLAIRLFGKRELSQLSVTDLVLILLISNAVQNAMVGPDTSLLGGIVAALTLFLINYIFKFFLFKSSVFSRWVEGESTMLIYKGEVLTNNMKREKITYSELEAVVREHGVDDIKHVKLAILEKDGNISILSEEIAGQTLHQRKRHGHPKLKGNT